MKTIKNIAASARQISAGSVFCLIFLAGCSALPTPPVRPVQYDFGPGALAAQATDRRASLAPLALADVQAPGLPEGSPAVLYRLLYADAQQLRPYSQARWSQPPAQLVQQRLREHLGERRAVIAADDAVAQVRNPAAGGLALLRTELEEFSHVFTSPADSAGVVRLRATLVELTPAGERLRGQRVFTAQPPARSADATGGVAALAEATTQVAQELAQWVEQVAQAER